MRKPNAGIVYQAAIPTGVWARVLMSGSRLGAIGRAARSRLDTWSAIVTALMFVTGRTRTARTVLCTRALVGMVNSSVRVMCVTTEPIDWERRTRNRVRTRFSACGFPMGRTRSLFAKCSIADYVGWRQKFRLIGSVSVAPYIRVSRAHQSKRCMCIGSVIIRRTTYAFAETLLQTVVMMC